MSDERLRLSPNSTLEIKSSGDDVLEVEATYDAGGSPPPEHICTRRRTSTSRSSRARCA